MVYSQSPKDKLSASIQQTYQTFESPVQIQYKVYPYGGSGNYEYRWKLKGEKKSKKFTGETIYNVNFECQNGKRPEITAYCEIRDKQTGAMMIASVKHAVEFCTTKN